VKKIITLFTTTLILGLSGCGSDSSSTTPSNEEEKQPSLIIPITGNTVKSFTFQDENILFTRGCATAKLFDSSSSELSRDSDTELGIASNGSYTYIANIYSYNSADTAYAIVYAKSMVIVPETLINGTTYTMLGGGKDIKKLVLSENKTLIATASSAAHIKVYDENLNFSSDLYVTSTPITLNAGTYYLLLKAGNCVTGTQITVNIL
jgi:hypothetical protein